MILYMPSTYVKKGSTQNHIDTFNEAISELESIIEKYLSIGYTIIMGGDSNDSELKRKKLFEDFLEKNYFSKAISKNPEIPTFISYNKRDSSHIDHIITPKTDMFKISEPKVSFYT